MSPWALVSEYLVHNWKGGTALLEEVHPWGWTLAQTLYWAVAIEDVTSQHHDPGACLHVSFTIMDSPSGNKLFKLSLAMVFYQSNSKVTNTLGINMKI